MKVLNKEFAYYVRIIFHYTYMLWIYKYFKALCYLQLQVWVNKLPYLIYNSNANACRFLGEKCNLSRFAVCLDTIIPKLEKFIRAFSAEIYKFFFF